MGCGYFMTEVSSRLVLHFLSVFPVVMDLRINLLIIS